MKKFFTKNVGTKLVSLLLAFCLWIFVGLQNPELTMNYRDITVAGAQDGALVNAAGLSVVGFKSQKIEVVAKGKRSILTSFNSSEIRAWVDTSEISEPGTYNLTVHVTMPVSDLFIERVTPAKVNVRLDKMTSKSVPVALLVDNELDGNTHIIDTQEFQPKSIQITGPQTEISQITQARVNFKVSSDGTSSAKEPFVLVNAAGEEIDRTYITTSVDKVDITVPVLSKKEVPLKVDLVNNAAGWTSDQISYTVTPSRITIIGEKSVLDTINELNIGRINLSSLTENPVYNFDIVLPKGVKSTNESLKASVSVMTSELDTQTVTVKNITVTGLPPETEALVKTTSVDIKLRGKKDELAKVTEADISAVIDLKGKDIAYGEYEMPLTVSVKAAGTVSVSGEYTATVKLVKKKA